MSIWDLFILAVGLSMDAFAVSVCKGLSLGKLSLNICALQVRGSVDFRHLCRLSVIF